MSDFYHPRKRTPHGLQTALLSIRQLKGRKLGDHGECGGQPPGELCIEAPHNETHLPFPSLPGKVQPNIVIREEPIRNAEGANA